MPWVEMEELSKTFGAQAALRDFNIAIKRGELVSLLGPSGCGKTTTLRIVAGFETPDSGQVRIDGENILHAAPHRRRMGMVFQNYALFPHLTAAENIAFGMRIAGRRRDEISRRVDELLALVKLHDIDRNKMPRQMSGGQQQRVAVARALAIEPRMLLLDEPLSALDAVVRLGLRDQLREIQTALSMTTIFVTHDQEEALAISDRIVVMRDGQIEQVGTPEEIYAQPRSRFVAGFIGKMNILDGQVSDTHEGRVRCGDHQILVPAESTERMQVGQGVTLLVRPEAISLSEPENAAASNSNSLIASVDGVTFLGVAKRFALNARGHPFIVDVPTAQENSFRRGDRVALSFRPDACRVLAPDRAA
jgi:putative spermidine/putrescine transport system ATP-binding protein